MNLKGFSRARKSEIHLSGFEDFKQWQNFKSLFYRFSNSKEFLQRFENNEKNISYIGDTINYKAGDFPRKLATSC